jgi:putative acetyltransferase
LSVTERPYRPDDAPRLLALFRDTIRRVNARDYDSEQIRAWASEEIDPAAWAARFAGRFVVVAEEGERLAGFAELETDGHIDRVYVSADHQHRGIGRRLLIAVIDEARRRGLPRLFVEASITARPFFAALGFGNATEQVVTCRGVEFVNYRMEMLLAESATSPLPAAPRPRPGGLLRRR